jgi:hypothetical protein
MAKYGDGEEMESVKMTKYEKRGERRGKCKLKKERGRRRAQHLEKISFFEVLLAISLSDFWTKS